MKDLCRKHGFSEGRYYLWRSRFGGMSVSDAKRLKELETENGRLKTSPAALVVGTLVDGTVNAERFRR